VSWNLLRRLHALGQELTRRYPDDAEAWYTLGEARYHWGSPVGSSPRGALEVFDRAIRSDSSFAPAYLHPIELALWLDGPAAAHRYAAAYLRLRPTDASAGGIRLADQVLESSASGPQELRRLLRTTSPSTLHYAWLALGRSADSLEPEVEVSRALAAAPEGDAPWIPPWLREAWLGVTLLHRGHLRQAVGILFHSPIPPVGVVEAALLTRDLPDTTERMFRSWVTGRPLILASASLPWWMIRGDSGMLRAIGRRADSVARSPPSEVERNVALFTSAAAHAYVALVRRDSTSALRQFEALPDSLCPLCYFPRLTLAQLLSARHEDRKAAALLDHTLAELKVPSDVLWQLERARVEERLGEREKAVHDYQYVADVWRHADPELQPYVAEARDGLARLTSEPRH
jgi:serine/threonine-protein kinase